MSPPGRRTATPRSPRGAAAQGRAAARHPDTSRIPPRGTESQPDTVTGQAVAVMDIDDARRLTERIRYSALGVRDGMEKLQNLVDQAQAGSAHIALGFKSWTDYLSQTLGQEPLRLARDDRQALVGYLAGEGMSTRAIAPIVGASQSVVDRDIRVTQNGSVERPATVTSLDGRQRPATHVRAAPRRPLPVAYRDTAEKALRDVQSLSRLHQDTRFTANRAAVGRHAHLLARAANELCDLLDDLGVNRHQYGGAR